MTDERWLSKETRAQSWDAPKGTWQRMLCDHAEAADELIAELAERLRVSGAVTGFISGCDCVPCVIDRALLARVDALTKDTA